MADRLSLSLWLRGGAAQNQLRRFEKLLRLFPYSKLSTGDSILRILAMDFSQPPVTESRLEAGFDPGEVARLAGEFLNPDSGFEFITTWDLWRFDGRDWQLAPAVVSIFCFGPEFQSEEGEHLRIDFGDERQFLPQPDQKGFAMVQSNIRSLLQLVHQIENELPVDRRQLWSESGDNFADKLKVALGEAAGHLAGPH